MLRAAFTSALHGPAVQASHSKTAWLLRFPGATWPHAEHRCDVYAAGICSTRPKALCCKRVASRPHPLRRMARLRPRFWATRWPGCSTVPRCGAGHRPHVKGFDADRVEASRDVGGGLFDPVLAPVVLTRSQFRDRQFCASSPVGAALCTGQALLQRLQPLRLTRGETGGMQQFAGRQSRRHRNTTVDAHHASVARTGDGVRDVGERDMPAPGPVAGNAVGLHARWDGPRQAKAHPANLGHPHASEPAIKALDVMRFDRDLPEPLMYTGFAPRRAAVRSAEEVAHRLGEIPQRLLLHGLGTREKSPPTTRTRREPRSTEHTARYSRARGDQAANAAAAQPPGSTHTGHRDNASPTPPPAQW